MTIIQGIALLLPVLAPVLGGICLLTFKRLRTDRRMLVWVFSAVLVISAGLAYLTLYQHAADDAASGAKQWLLWRLTDSISISFFIDELSCLFAALTASVWLLAGIYAVSYMKHEQEEHRFYGCYLIVLGVLIGLDFSANLVTMYVFYELMTLTSLPLILHERTKEAVMAGLKYLFYSVAGAFLALFGIFFLASICSNLSFIPGGVLAGADLKGKEQMLLASVFCMILGFGAKAGMFPLHAWLPTAHPVAPAPASAVLSGLITKSGVLAIVRVVYYIVGPEYIQSTWVQNAWIFLALLTVFMGSMLAYKEPVMKKRLAYSTVSQVSYMLFGLGLLHPLGFVGALSHVVFHSLIKNALFLIAGSIILSAGRTRVDEMQGIGNRMPILLGCYTLVSLALVGIPPASGFISKWYLATGALASDTGVWSWTGPVVLLVSALLTAGYLLPLTIQGFFPGEHFGEEEPEEKQGTGHKIGWEMMAPVLILTAGALLFGCFPSILLSRLESIAASVL